MPWRRAVDFINRRLDELFPRPWLDQWNHAHAQGWRPDAPDAYCKRCGSTMHATGLSDSGCAFCLGKPVPWKTITRLTAYDATMAQWVHQLKFQRQWKWATLLGRELGLRMTPPTQPDRTIVCPVPLHAWRRMQRGYNQSQLLAEEVAGVHRLPMVTLLRKTRATVAQSSLSPTDRQANARRVYAMPEVDLTGHHVWLVDDVKTTGSTLRACARLLRQAGADRVDVAVLAVADPKGAQFTRL